ncbi:MAG: hypothetical protein O2938_09480 [Proteobacteria bacterium]|nr:hypothetical protein [Pseudomonadota bacterium]
MKLSRGGLVHSAIWHSAPPLSPSGIAMLRQTSVRQGCGEKHPRKILPERL